MLGKKLQILQITSCKVTRHLKTRDNQKMSRFGVHETR